MKFGLVLAAVLVLTGCVAVPPPGPSDDEIAATQQHFLDKTWASTGLGGDQPVVEAAPPVASDVWAETLFTCVRQLGFQPEGVQYSLESGAELLSGNSEPVDDPDLQRAFYQCVAANPRIPDERERPLSEEQLDFIYDYYQSWLVPCMIMNGFTPSAAPTRVEFHALAGQWNPYYAVDVGLGGVEYEELERICGAERPQLY